VGSTSLDALYPIRRAASLFPERGVKGPDASVAYRDMPGRIEGWVYWLESLGVRKGDIFAIADVNSVRFMELVYAAARIGAIILPVNFRLPPLVLEEILREADPKILAYSSPFSELARLWPRSVELPPTITGRAWSREEFYGDPDADFVLLYTSGTTGRPKGVLYTQAKMLEGGLSIAHQLGMHETNAKLSSRDTILSLIPMFHILSWGSVFIAPYIGARLVFTAKFDPIEVTEILRREATWFNAVPTMLAMILQALNEELPGVKALIGGSPLPKKLWDLAKKRGIRISTIYGATDMLATAISIETDHTRGDDLRLVVHPVPGAEVRVVRPDGSPAKPGEMGEILYRSPWMPEGYYKNPEKTREAFRDGWFHTGDVGVMREDGGIMVLDRLKDAVKSGGEWIPTSVLESIISEVAGVEMVAVIPVPDEKWGERPAALYTGTAEPEEIRRHLEGAVEQGRIAKWWIPDHIVRVEELPLTSTGKINKRLLREKWREIVGGTGS